MSSSYTKLRDGSWGVRVSSDVAVTPGSQIYVTTKAGATKVETIVRVLWSGNGVSICTIIGQRAKPTATYARREGSPGCMACRRAGTWCASCAFDEFDC